MSLEIEKLAAKFADYARIADEDGNKKLENNEVSVFGGLVEDAIKKGELNLNTDETKMFASMGVSINTKSTAKFPATTEAREYSMQESLKKMRKDGYHGTELLRMLEARNGNGPELETVKQMYDLVEATGYKSKEDVKNIEKNIKSQYPNLSKFAKKVLEAMVEEAEGKQISREYEQNVKPLYEEILSKQTDKKNYEKAVEDTKKELKNKGLWKESYTKDAYKELENVAKNQAKLDVNVDYKSTTATKIWGKNGIRHQMKENGYNGKDDYQEDARTREKMLITKRHNRFVENRDEKLGNISDKEVHSILRRDFKDYGNFRLGKNKAYHKLIGSKYAQEHQNADGTYNFQELANEVQKRAGSEYLVSLSSDKETKELYNIRKYLSNLLGQNLNTLETREIIELCGLKVEARDYGQKTLVTAVPGLVGALSGFLASPVIKANLEQNVNFTLNVDESMAEDIIQQFNDQELGEFIQNNENGSIGVHVHQLVEALVDQRGKAALTGAALGVVTGALLAAVLSDDQLEKSVYNVIDMDLNDPQYKDFNKFSEYIRSRYPKDTADMIIAIAQIGGWDPARFDSIIKSIAGLGSHMNKKEKAGAEIYSSEVKVPETKIQEEIKEPEKTEESKKTEEKKEDCPPNTECKEEVVADFITLGNDKVGANKYNWNTIYALYADCLKQNGGTHTEAEIRNALYKYNGVAQTKNNNIFTRVDRNGKSIPINLPKDLFGDGCLIKNLNDNELNTLRRQGQVKGAKGRGTVGQYRDGRYYVEKECTETDANGNVTKTKKRSKEAYNSKAEAQQHINDDTIY